MARLPNQVAFISGISGGIGTAIAKAFAAEGAIACGCYAPGEPVPLELVAALERNGPTPIVVPADVADAASVTSAIRQVEDRFGRVDILVTCAGHAEYAPIVTMPVESFERMLRVHVIGTFLCCQAVLPGMLARRSGTIVTVASQIAYIGAENLSHYVAAKAAVIGFTKSLAREVTRHGIRVNGIAPGPVQTGILPPDPEFDAHLAASLPIGRFARPDEIAPTAVFLASDDASYYVGQILRPDGGEVML